jgi:hypothetical protein
MRGSKDKCVKGASLLGEEQVAKGNEIRKKYLALEGNRNF